MDRWKQKTGKSDSTWRRKSKEEGADGAAQGRKGRSPPAKVSAKMDSITQTAGHKSLKERVDSMAQEAGNMKQQVHDLTASRAQLRRDIELYGLRLGRYGASRGEEEAAAAGTAAAAAGAAVHDACTAIADVSTDASTDIKPYGGLIAVLEGHSVTVFSDRMCTKHLRVREPYALPHYSPPSSHRHAHTVTLTP